MSFGGNGSIAAAGCSVPSVDFVPFVEQSSPWSAEIWTEKLFSAAGKLSSGKAPGHDEVPPELLRYGG